MKFNMLEKSLYWQYISLVQKAPNYAANLKETDLRPRTFLWYCSVIFNWPTKLDNKQNALLMTKIWLVQQVNLLAELLILFLKATSSEELNVTGQ